MSNGHLNLSDIRRVVDATIQFVLHSTTSGIYVHWPVTTMIIGATTLKILCVISIRRQLWCHLCLEIARIPARNNSNGHDAFPLPVFHLFSLLQRICFLRFTSAASGMFTRALFFKTAISWDTWQKPDKDPFLMSTFFKTPWNNIFGTQFTLHTVLKNLTFIVTSSVTFETFGELFLPLENSFRFFQIVLYCKYPESIRIWKNLQGAKTTHQRFFFGN